MVTLRRRNRLFNLSVPLYAVYSAAAALFLLLGTLMRQPIYLGLIYIFVWEGFIGSVKKIRMSPRDETPVAPSAAPRCATASVA